MHSFPFYRGLCRYDEYKSIVTHTCTTQIGDLIDVERDMMGDYILYYDTVVNVLSGNGTETGLTEHCVFGVYCSTFHFSNNQFICDASETFPANVTCWTSGDSAVPACSKPGETWRKSLGGTIFAVIFAFIFFAIAIVIEKSFKQAPPSAVTNAEVFGVVEGTQAAPVVVGVPISN